MSYNFQSFPVVKMRKDPSGHSWACIAVPQHTKGRNVYWTVYDPDGNQVGDGHVSSLKGANDAGLRCCKRAWTVTVRTVAGVDVPQQALSDAQAILKGTKQYVDTNGRVGGFPIGRVAAIKHIRKVTGLGLKEAKIIVDQMEGPYG